MTENQFIAFFILPLFIAAVGWGVALWARREADRAPPPPGE